MKKNTIVIFLCLLSAALLYTNVANERMYNERADALVIENHILTGQVTELAETLDIAIFPEDIIERSTWEIDRIFDTRKKYANLRYLPQVLFANSPLLRKCN